MDMRAKVTSKGQVTIPKGVREALGVGPGDHVLFRVVEGHAVLARTPDFLDLAGAVEVPPELKGRPWQEIRAIADEARLAEWRRGQR
jgi:AbrB family looped-hinge helix DNA binding protein